METERDSHHSYEVSRFKGLLESASHELRTPLNAIIGFTSLIYDGKTGPVSADQKEYLGDILDSSRHLLQMITDILDLSRIESGRLEFRPEEVDLNKLVGDVSSILKGVISKKKLQVQFNISSELGSVFVDSTKLKKVIYHYLSNAIKFTPEQGTIKVSIVPEDVKGFRIDVEDSGIGVKAEALESLFLARKSRDSEKAGGMGISLALTKQLVEAQGGSVFAKSVQGKGSTFSAILPRRFDAKSAKETQ